MWCLHTVCESRVPCVRHARESPTPVAMTESSFQRPVGHSRRATANWLQDPSSSSFVVARACLSIWLLHLCFMFGSRKQHALPFPHGSGARLPCISLFCVFSLLWWQPRKPLELLWPRLWHHSLRTSPRRAWTSTWLTAFMTATSENGGARWRPTCMPQTTPQKHWSWWTYNAVPSPWSLCVPVWRKMTVKWMKLAWNGLVRFPGRCTWSCLILARVSRTEWERGLEDAASQVCKKCSTDTMAWPKTKCPKISGARSACCPKDLKEYFDMSSDGFVCSNLRAERVMGSKKSFSMAQSPKTHLMRLSSTFAFHVTTPIHHALRSSGHWLRKSQSIIE